MTNFYFRLVFILIIIDSITACKKERIDYPASANTWTFQAAGHLYAGKIVMAIFKDSAGKGNLYLKGFTSDLHADTTFELALRFHGETLDTGWNLTSDADFGNYFVFRKSNDGDVIFYAGEVASPRSIEIRVDSYNSGTHLVKGSFDGQVNDYNLIYPYYSSQLTNGYFEAVLQ